MINELKFRAWDKGHNKMSYKVNLYSINLSGIINKIQIDNKSIMNSIGFNCELMRFTGFMDKNKVAMYEGDIILLDGGGEEKPIMDIRWEPDYGMWVVYPSWLYRNELAKPDHVPLHAYTHPAMRKMFSVEVIGNIYENPELLKSNI